MGAESFFLNLRLSNTEQGDFKKICSGIETNGFEVKTTIRRKVFFFVKTRKLPTNCAIINRVILLEYDEKYKNISLQACFSCFQKSHKYIAELYRCLYQCNIVSYAYYGNNVIEGCDFAHLERIITAYTVSQHRAFIQKYSERQVDILPGDEFYRNYRKYYR